MKIPLFSKCNVEFNLINELRKKLLECSEEFSLEAIKTTPTFTPESFLKIMLSAHMGIFVAFCRKAGFSSLTVGKIVTEAMAEMEKDSKANDNNQEPK